MRAKVLVATVLISSLNSNATGQPFQDRSLKGQINWLGSLANRFNAGDTNVPILSTAWYFSGVWFSSVDQTGRVSGGLDTGSSIRGGGSFSLDGTNMELLIQTVNSLPAPPDKSLADEQKIVVAGIRNNQWFSYAYDRSDIPNEVEELYAMLRAPLIWFIPQTKGTQAARVEAGEFACVARDQPIAVIVGSSLLRTLDMTGSPHQLSPTLNTTPYLFRGFQEDPVVISPNGRMVVLSTPYAIHAIDWRSDLELWKAGPWEVKPGPNFVSLAIGGDQNQFLFVARTHTVERWDLTTGQRLATLATNEPPITFLSASRNGQVLVAGLGERTAPRPLARSFIVWEAGRNEPGRRFVESASTAIGLSPNGDQIVLSVFGRGKLVLYNWRTDERTEFPMRIPYGAHGILAMYWSPDGKRVAALVDSQPASVITYETLNWKPIVHWLIPRAFNRSQYAFDQNGTLLELNGPALNALEIAN